MVDLELSTMTGDLPQVTVTLSEPYAMQYTAARTSDGADVMLNWDRNDPSSNVHVTSRFTDSSDVSKGQHDLDIKVCMCVCVVCMCVCVCVCVCVCACMCVCVSMAYIHIHRV